jgi:DNA-binding NtrC family response regulator
MKSPRILSVDFDPAVLSSRNAILERAGYTVVSARKTQEFRDLLQRGRFDLALLGTSISMPEKKLICAEVKKQNPQVWIVACCRGTEVIEALREKDLVDAVVDPFDGGPTALIQAVNILLLFQQYCDEIKTVRKPVGSVPLQWKKTQAS